MTNQVFSPSRRGLLAGLGGTALTAGLRLPAAAQSGASLSLRARPGTIPLQAGGTGQAVWMLDTDQAGALRFGKGDLAVNLSNELPAPIVLNWLGIDGAAAAEPLTGQAPVLPGGRASFTVPLRQSGTYLVNALVPEGAPPPTAGRALIVEDSPPVAVDRDAVLLIEEWRFKSGVAVAPGTAPDATPAIYTVNGQLNFSLNVKINERLRLRFINGCARSPVGLKIENHDVRVMAIDGAPAEPFTARDGQLVLAPGSRVDAFIDATRAPGTISPIILHDGASPQTIARLIMSNDAPVRAAALPLSAALPSVGLPARLDLQGALRAELSLDPNAQWGSPVKFDAATAPAWRVKRGRTAVMAITNPATAPVVFRLHGHHFRLLDRLDDGWKPFWLDTLMLDKGQTQRIAFLAEYSGRWLMEATALNWAAPKLLRSYAVE
ncbi:multicopper oxidase domain-containing protein [Bradyrhizobium sp. G127]|uniref:multicopper oxidase family protein n=1 Tax=Bradyrhizobium sp. G127 TaxID=2904800 RepID=UPI001F3172DE|nr:multicopper oxidase domain-containing protein [Bradyrhizobium sp. G127]MCF2523836.1 multicopper oxidase domain-containing protein [Bradyrhizobium sp. G127]